MKRIRAVIFDLDGTVADTLPLCIEAFRRSIEPLAGRSVSDAEIIATFGPSEEGTILALAPDHYEEGVAAYLHHYRALHAMCPRPFNGVRDLLLALRQKGVRIAMVTGKGLGSAQVSLERFGLDGLFEYVETGWIKGERKAECMLQILGNWGALDKAEVIYVGDTVTDIRASRKAGIRICSAAWASTADRAALEQEEPDALFDSIAAFSDWLLQNT